MEPPHEYCGEDWGTPQRHPGKTDGGGACGGLAGGGGSGRGGGGINFRFGQTVKGAGGGGGDDGRSGGGGGEQTGPHGTHGSDEPELSRVVSVEDTGGYR